MAQVSILIPAYNAEVWIRQSIESALAQTFADIEVLVVNDGSSDQTPAIVNQFQDSRLRLLHQPHSGQSVALNHGVAESRGAYIKFLDADDWLNPEHLSAQMTALKGRTDVVSSCRWGYFVKNPSRALMHPETVDRDYDDPLEWLADSLTHDEGMMGGWKWLIPRPVWDRCGGWNEHLSLNNDFDFSIKLLLASQGVRFAPGARYSYRKGIPGTLSDSEGLKAMTSAYLTTESGCDALLARENSPRIRRICADRWQGWLHRFYPRFPELADLAEKKIAIFGGSDLSLKGGIVLRCLLPLFGWRNVRKLQTISRQFGWERILRWKRKRRVSRLRLEGFQLDV